MSRGKNGTSSSNSNANSALHSDLVTPFSRNINTPSTSVGSNGRLSNSRLSNTVNLGFFVISKSLKRADVETDSISKSNHSSRKTTEQMKPSKFNGRDRRRSANNLGQSQEQQRLSFSSVANGVNLNNNKSTPSNNNKIYSSNSSFGLTEFNNIGSLKREGKEDYWYYDSRSDGFYYELNGSRGWRKRDKKHEANLISSQQQMRSLIPSMSTASSSAAVTNIVNSVSSSIFSTHQHQCHKPLIKNNHLSDSKVIPNSTSKFFPISNKSSVNNYYDAVTDGFYFEMASADGWRRRQPNHNQQISQPIQQQLRVYPQYQQPQSRIIRQLHNQYNQRSLSQNQIWKTLKQSYNVFLNSEAFKLTHKPQLNTQDLQTRNMSNAELDDMIINRSENLLNIANDLAILNFHKEHIDKAEKCCCNNTLHKDLVVNKSSSPTTINFSVCDSPLPDMLMSNFKYQIPLVSNENSDKSLWPKGNLIVEKDSISTNGLNKDSFLLSSLQHQGLAVQHQRQRNLQPGSFEEHYEFYTESDKASHENTPSVSSIDDLQQTIPVNTTQQYQTDVHSLQNEYSESINVVENSKENLSRAIKRPDSLRVSKNVANWGASVLQQQKPYVNMEEFIADIPALNDNSKNLSTIYSNESFAQPARFGGFNAYDSFVSNSPLVTPMAFKENVYKDWMWDPSKSELNLSAAVATSNDLTTSFSNLLTKDPTYPIFEEKSDANAVLEQNVKDIAKLWQCPAF